MDHCRFLHLLMEKKEEWNRSFEEVIKGKKVTPIAILCICTRIEEWKESEQIYLYNCINHFVVQLRRLELSNKHFRSHSLFAIGRLRNTFFHFVSFKFGREIRIGGLW